MGRLERERGREGERERGREEERGGRLNLASVWDNAQLQTSELNPLLGGVPGGRGGSNLLVQMADCIQVNGLKARINPPLPLPKRGHYSKFLAVSANPELRLI